MRGKIQAWFLQHPRLPVPAWPCGPFPSLAPALSPGPQALSGSFLTPPSSPDVRSVRLYGNHEDSFFVHVPGRPRDSPPTLMLPFSWLSSLLLIYSPSAK